jgi:hypothetical protein
LKITRATDLLSAVKRARMAMASCELTTPTSFLSHQFRQRAESLGQLQTRLTNVIRGVRIPSDDHER